MQIEKLDEITGLIEKGIPVLTVNRRLSRYLRGRYDTRMRDGGRLSWESPLILPLSAWAEGLYNEAADKPLLSRARSGTLWEKVVSENSPGAVTISKGVAALGYEAYTLLKEYGITLPDDELYLTEEARALKRWISSYESLVNRLGFIDRAGLIGCVCSFLEKGRVKAPEKLILAGFDELTPLTLSLMDRLRHLGSSVLFWPSAPPSVSGDEGFSPVKDIRIRRCRDEKDEVVEAARWARSVLIRNPEARIGVIAPGLEAYRDLIKREFAAELDPESALPWAPVNGNDGNGGNGVFNISLGEPLYNEPLVRSAIDVIAIGEGDMDMEKISPVLLSPFLFPQEDSLRLAGVDAALKRDNRLKASLFELVRRAGKAGASASARVFEIWLEALRPERKAEAPSFWAGRFSALLKNTGWLSHIRLSSSEFQALRAWNSLLEEFSTLDDVMGRIRRHEAAAIIKELAAASIHQPETPEAPVEALGMLEASGRCFDHIWLLGCHENALPPPPSPNPFIPVYLQKRHGLPHSSFEREAAYAKRALARIFKSASSFEVSFPGTSDERELELSPLFSWAPDEAEAIRALPSARLKDRVHAASALEDGEADERVPVGAGELDKLTGGTAIIKAQSICPFKAFAEFRLNARAIPEPEIGLTGPERGSLLHRALKAFWEEVEDSRRLSGIIEEDGADALIRRIIDGAFDGAKGPRLSARFMEMEKDRLFSVLKGWIEIEAKRASFTVKRIESEREIDIGGLKIRERPDRVDMIEGVGEAVIDYKSGDADRNDWLSSRPKDPQLIIYTLTGKYDAVSFARLKPGELRFIGIARSDKMLPGIKGFDDDRFREKFGPEMDWQRLMDFWKGVIGGLAEQFLAGVAEVDPDWDLKSEERPCRRCGLKILCRVSEAAINDGD